MWTLHSLLWDRWPTWKCTYRGNCLPHMQILWTISRMYSCLAAARSQCRNVGDASPHRGSSSIQSLASPVMNIPPYHTHPFTQHLYFLLSQAMDAIKRNLNSAKGGSICSDCCVRWILNPRISQWQCANPTSATFTRALCSCICSDTADREYHIPCCSLPLTNLSCYIPQTHPRLQLLCTSGRHSIEYSAACPRWFLGLHGSS